MTELDWEWDENSRDRQHRLLGLIVLCLVVTAVAYLFIADTTSDDSGQSPRTTEVNDG